MGGARPDPAAGGQSRSNDGLVMPGMKMLTGL